MFDFSILLFVSAQSSSSELHLLHIHGNNSFRNSFHFCHANKTTQTKKEKLEENDGENSVLKARNIFLLHFEKLFLTNTQSYKIGSN